MMRKFIKNQLKKIKKIYLSYLEKPVSNDTIAIAINQRPKSGPWGGGNHFLNQFIAYLQQHGIEIRFSLKPGVNAIFVVTGREDLNPEFFSEEIVSFKEKHNDVKCFFRVNECDLRKDTDNVDKSLRKMEQASDTTIFISEWLKKYFKKEWKDLDRKSPVIYNGADTSIFYPGMQKKPAKGEPWKIVTHHWSANANKGWYLYKEIDTMIAQGKLKNVELTVIGNWPEDIVWKTAQAFAPLSGKPLADELRKHHFYITGSLWEPCGYHHVEGAQCGLPLIYHKDGGGIVEAGEKYGLAFSSDVGNAINEAIIRYNELHKKVLDNMPSSDEMCRQFASLLLPDFDFKSE